MNKPIRVAVFEPFGNLYGSEQSLLELLRVLPVDIVKLNVYCPKQSPWIVRLDEAQISYTGWFEKSLHEKGRFRRSVALALFIAFLVKSKSELIHVNQFGALPYALMAARLLRIPVVYHSRWHEDGDSFERIRHLLSSLRAVICISQYQRKLLGTSSLGEIPVTVIPNPCSLLIKSLPCIVNDDPVFICPARLHPHKNQKILLKACREYIDRFGPCRVLLIGSDSEDSEYKNELLTLTNKLGIGRYVEFMGFDPDWMRNAFRYTALVLPSLQESLGRVIFEAWDAGIIPVAWAGSGGPAETISASSAGFLYRHQEPTLLSNVLHTVATLSFEERKSIVERGLQWSKLNLDPGTIASQVLSVWSKAIKTTP